MSDSSSKPVPRLVVTSRPLPDYRNMFGLTDEEITGGPILDCAAGASPFGAQVRARGGEVVSVDPLYAESHSAITARIRADHDALTGWLKPDGPTNWDYLGSPGALLRTFEVAADYFLADLAANPAHYVAGALPRLPFPDKHFRLAVTSHLLFTYPHLLDVDDHIAGITELVRVTDGEVRVYPLVDSVSTLYPKLDDVRKALADKGISTEVRQTMATYIPGGDQLLACSPA
ncbi:hypothetical protein EV193_11932 [Herbihabitans rhizosphaerae]|uniref:Methyltransferase family protein n=1 Tax=Herbihabitans rhizosphaerae TaxID=1872711 RepID=A0A4Q7KDG6_9PSEU|nr:hypothetical protein [Herbihabitans rhizosphaerae]RZS29629.1 hypothetical protein EV193_11932 [Herbihabitans rhizosphaerae]